MISVQYNGATFDFSILDYTWSCVSGKIGGQNGSHSRNMIVHADLAKELRKIAVENGADIKDFFPRKHEKPIYPVKEKTVSLPNGLKPISFKNPFVN